MGSQPSLVFNKKTAFTYFDSVHTRDNFEKPHEQTKKNIVKFIKLKMAMRLMPTTTQTKSYLMRFSKPSAIAQLTFALEKSRREKLMFNFQAKMKLHTPFEHVTFA